MEKSAEDAFFNLFNDAKAVDIKGWDFSYVKDRMISEPPPWEYKNIIFPYVKRSTYMLDMGTGGGEFLSSLIPLPPYTYATEAYPPNIPVAAQALEKHSIQLVPVTKHEELPFPNSFFDLIINRHEYYYPQEVYRILKANGIFITQQVGKFDNIELNQFFGDESYKDWDWDLAHASLQLKKTGFKILDGKEALIKESFRDIGAIVFYLRIISWQIPDLDIDQNLWKFKELHLKIQTEGQFAAHGHRFLIKARCMK